MTMQIARTETPAERALAEDFAARGKALGHDAARSALFERFRNIGLPHRRIEEWKYTDLRMKVRDIATPAPFSVSTPAESKGVRVENSIDPIALEERFTGFEGPIVDLIAAFADTGISASVEAGATISDPLRAVYAQAQGKRSHAASVYRFGDRAQATLVETVNAPDGGGQSLQNTHLHVGDDTNITYIRHIDVGAGGTHLGGVAVTLGQNASFRMLLVVSSGDLVRTDIGCRFLGSGANGDLRGLHLAGSSRHVDTTLFVDHAVPDCSSRELFKAVLDDEARSVFQGKILVRPDAQKTDGKMMSQALMLSDTAEADSKPELEIYADDVQCGHGSTTGQIDDTYLFYLMARGVPRREAQAMLVSAFANEVFDDFDETLAAEFSGVSEGWLARHLG
ncbi:MAG: Fe-S cluster assembly protein SufD [Rhodobiaceae bacterium]|nr:Fe-S cluster assembly protein SufD [Rhodobiaceae bacterium]MCC0056961.1 Fe-S cluster assembly protein SufD [Rhodobiaceae bacterium]